MSFRSPASELLASADGEIEGVRPQKVHKLLCRLVLVWFKLGNKIEFPDVLFGINLATEKRLLEGGGGNGLVLHSGRWSPKAYGLD